MEQLVRPFQSVDPLSTGYIVVSTLTTTADPAHLCWGAAGTIPSAVQQKNFDKVNFRLEECDESLAQDGNDYDYEDVTVEQPGKPENYVVVRRIRRVNFKHHKKNTTLHSVLTADIEAAFRDFDLSGFFDLPERSQCHTQMYLNR
jgi:hypothetical protein